jgi:subtilisin family serine protease
VNAYLTAAQIAGVLPDANLFNRNGRGYPDVSALGGQTNAYCVAYNGGSFAGVAGTSASCPVVAGIIAQLNNVRYNLIENIIQSYMVSLLLYRSLFFKDLLKA